MVLAQVDPFNNSLKESVEGYIARSPNKQHGMWKERNYKLEQWGCIYFALVLFSVAVLINNTGKHLFGQSF